jgi:diamine N-acetyltransferase
MDTSQIEIRRATINDSHLISVLATTTFYEAYFEQDDPSDLADYIIGSFSPASISEQLEEYGSFFLLISLEGHAVGFARLVSGPADPSIKTEKTIALRRFYIV